MPIPWHREAASEGEAKYGREKPTASTRTDIQLSYYRPRRLKGRLRAKYAGQEFSCARGPKRAFEQSASISMLSAHLQSGHGAAQRRERNCPRSCRSKSLKARWTSGRQLFGRSAEYQLAVIDTAPGVEHDMSDMLALCKEATLVLVPTSPLTMTSKALCHGLQV